MKTTRNLMVIGMVAALCCSIANAQVIYSNAFNGGAGDINGTAPTYINPNAASFGGSLGAAFDVVTNNSTYGYAAYQNGTLDSKLNSVLLPFTPVSGYVYTLSASLTFTTTPPAGGWGGLGFAAHFPASNSGVADPRLGSSSLGGNPWALLNMAANGGGSVLFANGSSQGSLGNLMTSLNTPYPINLTLDTTGANWKTALTVNGTLVQNYTFSSNPSLSSFGYTQTTTTAGAFQWNSLTLSAQAVPEPSAPVLMGVGLAMMFLVVVYQRRRDAAAKTVL